MSRRAVMDGTEDRAGIRVLIVDDTAVDRRIAGGCVEELGAEAVYAENGREALRILEAGDVDVVLTDMQMPELDGLKLTEAVCEEHPTVPVVIMTAHGSEEVAVSALRAGASNYVPKQNMRRDLGEALRAVLTSVRAAKQRAQLRPLLLESEAQFVLDYDPAAGEALLGHLTSELAGLGMFDETEIMQVRTSLTEALRNAIDHGNLELDSSMRETSDQEYRELGAERAHQEPWCDRRVYITSRVSPSEVVYVIRDEGEGFDVSQLPDPRDPENLVRASGRGVLMMRMFMDEVAFNAAGNEVTMVLRSEAA
ncbi:MAG: response regulator [Planctomycetota bacterium]|nr:response regulator [Planctomycetota bacterium]